MIQRLRNFLCAFVMLSLGAAACTSSKEQIHDDENNSAQEEPARDIVTLDTAAIRLGGIEIGTAQESNASLLAVTGTITYDGTRISHIGSRTSGRVVTVHTDLGARVTRGKVLAVLESPDIGQTRAEARQADALLKIAQENHVREQRLEQQGISSRKELLDAEAELRRAEAAQRSAHERLRVLGATHGIDGEFTVTAPFAGTVVTRHASLGEMVVPEDTLFTVADLSHVWIELDIFERDVALVRQHQIVTITTDAYPGRTFTGRIVYVSEILNPSSRTALARVDIPNESSALKPGMFARAYIDVGNGASQVVVPHAAVQTIDGRTVVFVPGASPGEFRSIPVETGSPVGDSLIAIRKGLSAGQSVVVKGAFSLRSELEKNELEDGHAH